MPIYSKSYFTNSYTTKSFCVSEADVAEDGYHICNDLISKIYFSYSDKLIMQIVLTNNRTVFDDIHSCTSKISENVCNILNEVLDLFQFSTSSMLDELSLIPVRIILDDEGVCIGIGHFMKDEFIYIPDLIRLAEKQLTVRTNS